MSETLELAKTLIARPSVTPEDSGCQDLLASRLEPLGFHIQHLPFGDVKNLFARYGNEGPLLIFVGHTDVVPPGPLDQWATAPFEPVIKGNKLYGRGSADMKGSVAAMITACESFVKDTPKVKGSIGILLTSDEEGPSVDGIKKVAAYFQQQNIKVNYCLVGEPTCSKTFGDTIKVGRRGSLSGDLTIHGTQGHIAYPHLAHNPIHVAASAIDELTKAHWDDGNTDFQPTQFQISNIHAGTGANNVIPGDLFLQFNFRFSTETSADHLVSRVQSILDEHELDFDIQWHLSGEPYLTPKGALRKLMGQVVEDVTNVSPEFCTRGGTSDGRFIAPLGTEVVEFGPLNSSIHKINEWVHIAELDQLHKVYKVLLQRLFS